MSPDTTTPRTDAHLESGFAFKHSALYRGKMHVVFSPQPEFCRQLERELQKADSEVARLQTNLRRAVEIAEEYMVNVIHSPRKDELDAIKAQINS